MSFERSASSRNGADQVDQLTQPGLVEGRAGVVLGQNALQARVVALDRVHRGVEMHPYLRGLGGVLERRPTGLGRHPEHLRGEVLVGILGVRLGVGREGLVASLERVRDVLQEDEAEHDVLVLSGVHVAAELVGGRPEDRLEAEGRPVVLLRLRCRHSRSVRGGYAAKHTYLRRHVGEWRSELGCSCETGREREEI